MRSIYLFLLSILSFSLCTAQEEIAMVVEDFVDASYPGGIDALHEQIQAGLKYPASARKRKIEGIVDLSFTIDRHGFIRGIKVMKSLDSECDAAAIEALRAIGRWKPARMGGEPVSSQFEVPVIFFLEKASKPKGRNSKR